MFCFYKSNRICHTSYIFVFTPLGFYGFFYVYPIGIVFKNALHNNTQSYCSFTLQQLLNISLPMHFVTYVGVVRHVKPVHILFQATYRRSLSSVEYVVVDLVSYSVLYTWNNIPLTILYQISSILQNVHKGFFPSCRRYKINESLNIPCKCSRLQIILVFSRIIPYSFIFIISRKNRLTSWFAWTVRFNDSQLWIFRGPYPSLKRYFLYIKQVRQLNDNFSI